MFCPQAIHPCCEFVGKDVDSAADPPVRRGRRHIFRSPLFAHKRLSDQRGWETGYARRFEDAN